MDANTVGVEQTRTVVATMQGLPAKLDPETREVVQRVLTAQAAVMEPRVFSDFARQVELRCDPDAPWTRRTRSTRSNSPWAAGTPLPG